MKSIRRRLIFSMALLIAFFLIQAVTVTGFVNVQSRDTADEIRRNTLTSAQLTELGTLAQQIRRYEKEYFVYVRNEEKRNGYIKEFEGTSLRISKLLDSLLANADKAYSNAELAEITRWRAAHMFYTSEMQRIFGEVKRVQVDIAAFSAIAAPARPGTPTVPQAEAPTLPSPDQVNDMIKAGKDRFGAELISGVARLGKLKTEATLNLAQNTTASYKRLLGVIMATVLAGVAIAIYLAVVLPRAVARPIVALAKVAELVARGDMDKPFSAEGTAEFEPLARSLEKMRAALSVMTRKLRTKAVSETS